MTAGRHLQQHQYARHSGISDDNAHENTCSPLGRVATCTFWAKNDETYRCDVTQTTASYLWPIEDGPLPCVAAAMPHPLRPHAHRFQPAAEKPYCHDRRWKKRSPACRAWAAGCDPGAILAAYLRGCLHHCHCRHFSCCCNCRCCGCCPYW